MCVKPLNAYRDLNSFTRNGKNKIIVLGRRYDDKDLPTDGSYEPLILPCGQCRECRLSRSRVWALRCVHEASLYSENCFVTLTFNDDNLNPQGTLVKSDFQKFMKRLRKHHNGLEAVNVHSGESSRIHFPIRYFHCGEYGSKLTRPHHHACIFNFDFHDKRLWKIRDGVRLYRSPELERLWPYGYCTVGDVTFESAAYVARYIMKKVNGDQAASHYVEVDEDTGEMFYLEPEYITMSRRPGIAKDWIEKNYTDVYPKDFTTINGKKFKPARYYDQIYDLVNPEDMERVKRKRLTEMRSKKDENTMSRLRQRDAILKSKAKKLVRGLENDVTNVCN